MHGDVFNLRNVNFLSYFFTVEDNVNRVFLIGLILFVACALNGCAEFLEDYQYSPIGQVSSAEY